MADSRVADQRRELTDAADLRVLVASGSMTSVTGLMRTLSRARGLEVVGFSRIVEVAVRDATEQWCDVVVACSDVLGTDGCVGIARALQRVHPQTAVLILAQGMAPADLHALRRDSDAMAAGALLEFPWTDRELVDAVRRVAILNPGRWLPVEGAPVSLFANAYGQAKAAAGATSMEGLRRITKLPSQAEAAEVLVSSRPGEGAAAEGGFWDVVDDAADVADDAAEADGVSAIPPEWRREPKKRHLGRRILGRLRRSPKPRTGELVGEAVAPVAAAPADALSPGEVQVEELVGETVAPVAAAPADVLSPDEAQVEELAGTPADALLPGEAQVEELVEETVAPVAAALADALSPGEVQVEELVGTPGDVLPPDQPWRWMLPRRMAAPVAAMPADALLPGEAQVEELVEETVALVPASLADALSSDQAQVEELVEEAVAPVAATPADALLPDEAQVEELVGEAVAPVAAVPIDVLPPEVEDGWAEVVPAVVSEVTLTSPPPPNGARDLGPKRRGHLVTVYSGKGGVGRTTIAINLACALAAEPGTRVALVDLDLQFGDVATLLDLSRGCPSITDVVRCLEGDGELDDISMDQILMRGPNGVRVLSNPHQPEQADVVGERHVKALIDKLRSGYDYIVVDNFRYCDEMAAEVLQMSDRVVVVSSATVTSLKNARLVLELLQKLEVPLTRTTVVLNNRHARPHFKADLVAKTLQCSVAAVLPYDEKTVLDAGDGGLAFVISKPKAAVSEAVFRLADVIQGRSPRSAKDRWKTQAQAQTQVQTQAVGSG